MASATARAGTCRTRRPIADPVGAHVRCLVQMVWLFSEGFASFSVSFEVCAYAMLDIVSKVIFCFIVMAGNDALVRCRYDADRVL